MHFFAKLKALGGAKGMLLDTPISAKVGYKCGIWQDFGGGIYSND
jgi:hypothetical protein